MNIKDCPIATLGSFGRNVAKCYENMNVVWDNSNLELSGQVLLDLMVFDPDTGRFLHRLNTFDYNLPYKEVAYTLRTYSSVMKDLEDLLRYVDLRSSADKKNVKGWLTANGYVYTGKEWIKCLQGDYEE